MKRLVGMTAMTAAMVVIGHGLLQDYGVLTVMKRAGLAYLAAFTVASLLVMIFRHGIQDDWIREENGRRLAEQKRKREARMAEEEARLSQQLQRSQESKQTV
jgi:hypothetical protein